PDVALYVLNQKRAHLRGLEERFAITLTIVSDPSVAAPQAFVIERGDQVHTVEAARAIAEQNQQAIAAPLEDEDDLEDDAIVEAGKQEPVEAAAPSTAPEHDEGEPRRRRRRRRGRGGRDGRDERGGEHREHIPIHGGSADYPAEGAGGAAHAE